MKFHPGIDNIAFMMTFSAHGIQTFKQ